jgi:hypothetical protein
MRKEASRMTAEYTQGEEPLIPMPALTLDALRRAVAIERRPSVAGRLHAAERALADPDADVRDRAIREAAEIVQAAYREVDRLAGMAGCQGRR